MKKLFVCLLVVIMLSACIAIHVSASYVTDEETFAPVGRIEMVWDANASKQLDVTDGDMSDWADAGYSFVSIMPENMVSWVGNSDTELDPGMPENWSISTYFVADSDWLYIGFFVTDPVFAYGDGNGYNGDAFQVCIDFGGRLGKMLKETPEDVGNPKNIFYSFSCAADGAPLLIMRQESDNDAWISEANGDGVKGAAKKTETGWSAEFALSWQQLYDDYSWKSWDDKNIYVGGDQELPLDIGCCLYYLDRNETNGDIPWAAGSTNGIADDAGTPQVSWTAYDNGLNLSLPYVDGMNLNCSGIVVLPTTETVPVETGAPETEAPTEPETEAPTAAPDTEAPTEAATQAATEAGTSAGTQAATEDEGCASVVGMGAVAVLAAAAAFVALKKKD